MSAPLGPRFQMDAPHDPSHVANHTEGTVSIWNNGDGNDLITLEHEGFVTIGAGKDRGWARCPAGHMPGTAGCWITPR